MIFTASDGKKTVSDISLPASDRAIMVTDNLYTIIGETIPPSDGLIMTGK